MSAVVVQHKKTQHKKNVVVKFIFDSALAVYSLVKHYGDTLLAIKQLKID